MLRRTVLPVVLLVLLSLIAAPVIAAGPGEPAAGTPGFAATLWQALTSLFAPSGSIMDPDGLTATGGACRGDNGSLMDPNGCPAAGNQAGTTSDRGSLMDPDG